MYKITYWHNGRIVTSLFHYSEKEVYDFIEENRLIFISALDEENKKLIYVKKVDMFKL